mgnify:CR=1 FL=1
MSRPQYERTFTPPTPESRAVIEKWIRMLRSNRNTQTRGHLRDTEGFCCLGVACKAAGRRFDKSSGNYRCDGHEYDLPLKVREALGLTDDNHSDHAASPGVRVGPGLGGMVALSTLNDQQRLTFHQIAYLIEQDWLKGTPVRDSVEEFRNKWDQGKYKKKLPK